jgi:hypothetical protein
MGIGDIPLGWEVPATQENDTKWFLWRHHCGTVVRLKEPQSTPPVCPKCGIAVRWSKPRNRIDGQEVSTESNNPRRSTPERGER